MIPNHPNATPKRKSAQQKRVARNQEALQALLLSMGVPVVGVAEVKPLPWEIKPIRLADLVAIKIPRNHVFTKRVCDALDMDARQLANILGLDVRRLVKYKPLERGALMAVESNDTITWSRLAMYLNFRLGTLLGLREELQRKLRDSVQTHVTNRLKREANDPNP